MFDNHNNTPTEEIPAYRMSTITTPAVLRNQWWSDTVPSLPAVKRRKRWHKRWWGFRIPVALLAVLVGLTVLGTVVPYPVKAVTSHSSQSS